MLLHPFMESKRPVLLTQRSEFTRWAWIKPCKRLRDAGGTNTHIPLLDARPVSLGTGTPCGVQAIGVRYSIVKITLLVLAKVIYNHLSTGRGKILVKIFDVYCSVTESLYTINSLQKQYNHRSCFGQLNANIRTMSDN